MKFIILIFLFALCFIGCTNPTNTNQKIDFTKTYEDAALTLTDAQLLYDDAIASKDSSKIADAKAKLDSARTVYLTSKTYYVANGGLPNAVHDELLFKTNNILGKAPNDTTTTLIIAAAKVIGADSAQSQINKAVKLVNGGAAVATKKIQRVADVVATSENVARQAITDANKKLKNTADTTRKRIEQLKKETNALKDLFRRKADTTRSN